MTEPPVGGETATASCEATVGFMGPVTGPVASLGEIQLNWVQYAVDVFNQELGIDITLVVADDQFDTAQSATIAAQFLDDEAMVATVGPSGSQQVDAAGAVFEANDQTFAFVSPSATRDGLTAPYTAAFRTVPSDADQGPASAGFMIDHGAQKVVVIDDQSSYSIGLAESVTEGLKAGGVQVINKSVSQERTDFSSLAGTIPDDADFVYLPWQLAANAQILANQMAEQGKEVTILGDSGLDSDEFTEVGSYIASFAPDIADIPASQPLLKGYLERYSETNTLGPPAFVAAQVISEAVDRVCEAGETPNRPNVLAEIRKTDIEESILGTPVSFTDDGDLAEGRVFFFQIQEDGTKTLVG